MLDVNMFDQLKIGLATAHHIKTWSHGEVKKPETINYRTLRPEKDGLFCEKIFGPTRDWECYCGKYKRVRFKGIICERCGVEVTRSKVRRERMGHIQLEAPVVHIWYLRGTRSWLAYLLAGIEPKEELKAKQLEKVIYFAANLVTWVDDEKRHAEMSNVENEYLEEVRAIEKERDLEIDRRFKELESEAESMESEGGDTKKLRKEADKDLESLRERYEVELDLVKRTFDEFKDLHARKILDDEILWRELRDKYGDYFEGGTGADAIKSLIDRIDFDEEEIKLRGAIEPGDSGRKPLSAQRRQKAIKRLKIVASFNRRDEHGRRLNDPKAMILDVVPVIPPELRPMVQLDGGRFATSDLNDLYRRVINRNNRLGRLLSLGAPEIIVNNEKRMLQEAVDALFDNGRRGRPVTGPGNRPLKSLSDMLKGKQGRFRQNLLGKRVDYSGRSVIVAGPSLRLQQCGLPKLMALELFKPFIMARLVERKSVQNIKAAKKMVDSMIPEVWDVLEEVIQEHPVLLNRAPTLHRLGLQAFEPVLVEGKAIQVHPLVCSAFNADFDGDQMAVHLPLSAEAQAEARLLMLSANNILSPAHGAPLATPTQDMVLGMYYLTYGPTPEELDRLEQSVFAGTWDVKKDGRHPRVFRSAQEAELAYEHGMVKLQDLAEYRRRGQGGHVLTTVGRIIFNDQVERALVEALEDDWDPESYVFVNQTLKKRDVNDVIGALVDLHGPHAIAMVLDAFKDLGFRFATRAGITISKNDVVVPPAKEEILERYEGEVGAIRDQYDTGLITQEERHEAVVEKWTAATDEVGQAMQDHLDILNPIFMMANSGARGSFKQIRQLAGMRGLMANPKGEIIERPIKANFMEGLSVLEYFISTHGARKGLADTALRTADSGYLTRRLVDVSQDVIIRLEDCGTKEHIDMPLRKDRGEVNGELVGRIAAKDFSKGRAKALVKADTMITRSHLEAFIEAFGDDEVTVPVRSVLKCEADTGICQRCYGLAMATGKIVAVGDAVGIIAAQSIGEPGTQLTLRTFHTGGVAGADITHGLPRVVELFEARKPKGLAQLAEEDGTATVEVTDKALKVTVTDAAGEEHAYSFPRRTRLFVENGDKIEKGRQLNEGSIYPHELLDIRGRTATELYLVAEVQKVYKSQGVDINDKHIEIIVRQMMKKVRVDQKGDAKYLPGQMVDRHEFAAENAQVKAAGGEEAQYAEIILGITKASLATDSFLSAASFQETTKVLTDAALEGKTDRLLGLKENVIIGKLIPAATGLRRYRRLEIEPTEPVARPLADDIGLLDDADLAAELGLTSDGGIDGFGFGGNGGTGDVSFGDELADLAARPPVASDESGPEES